MTTINPVNFSDYHNRGNKEKEDSMKRNLSILMIIFICLVAYAGLNAQTVNMEEIENLYDSTQIVEAKVFAPETSKKAQKYYGELKSAVSANKKAKVIAEKANKFREFAENSIKSSEVTKLALEAYLEPRNKAKEAKARSFVPDLYEKAELQFIKATKKVEGGDTKGAKKIIEKAIPLFQIAELEAIKTDILGKARTLIAQAETDDGVKYAPATFDKAKVAFQKCIEILTNDRYERDKSLKNAALSEYQALHASNIAQSVRSLKKNDQAWEKLMLLYEIEMQKVGNELEMGSLPFDRGPIGAADAMVNEIRTVKGKFDEYEKGYSQISTNLMMAFHSMDIEPENSDAVSLSSQLERSVGSMVSEKQGLQSRLTEKNTELADLTSDHEEMSNELLMRQAKEAKIDSARGFLNPTEGQVLLNATDDVIIRLLGISFASGSSDIQDSHVELLGKVKSILEMFSGHKLMVEGHTDDRGERTTNMRLSEKRAFSVMQYLRSIMTIQADRISAVGYGPDKPIGTNTTKEGRAKNRRIDIIIFQ